MKFSNFFKVLLSMALVLTVGFMPTVAKASIYNYVGFSGSATFSYQYASYGLYTDLFKGSPGASASGGFTGISVDQTPDNMRLVLNFDGSSLVSSKGRYVEFTTLFQLKARDQDNQNNFFNPNSITGVSIKVSDGVDTQTVYANFSFNQVSSGSVFLTFSFYTPIDIDTLNIVVYFDFYNAFGFNVGEYTEVANFFGVQNYYNVGKRADFTEIPEWDGEYDLDDLPPLDDYIPDEQSPLMLGISKFTNLPVVVDMMIVVSVMGVLAYVVFGKRS